MTSYTKTIKSYGGSNYTYTVNVSETEVDTNNNRSKVKIEFKIKGYVSSGNQYSGFNENWGILIDGSGVGTGVNASQTRGSGTYTIGSYEGYVSHNSDGTKSIKVGVYLWHGKSSPNTNSYLPQQTTASNPITMAESFGLTTIPRQAVISNITDASGNNISSANTGTIVKIIWEKPSSNFKYRASMTLGSTTLYYPSSSGFTTDGAASFSITHAMLPSATKGTATFKLTTYNSSGTAIGSVSSKTLSVIVPSSVVPTIGSFTASLVDGTGVNGLYVQGKSKCYLKMSNCAAGEGSSIASYRIIGQGVDSSTISATTDTLTLYDNLIYTAIIKDTRGRTASLECTIFVYSYDAPTIVITALREITNPTTTKITYNTSYSSINGNNLLGAITVQRRENGTSIWSDVVTTDPLNDQTSGYVNITGCDVAKSYEFQAVVSDTVYGSTATSKVVDISTAVKLININTDTKSFALGKYCEKENSFECDFQSFFNNDMTVENLVPWSTSNSNASFYTLVPTIPYTVFGSEVNTEAYLKSLIAWICEKYVSYSNTIFISRTDCGTSGLMSVNITNTSNVDNNGYPQYANGTLFTDNNMLLFKFDNYEWKTQTINKSIYIGKDMSLLSGSSGVIGGKGVALGYYDNTISSTYKPTNYGFVLSIGNTSTDWHQLWFAQSDTGGAIYQRGGNGRATPTKIGWSKIYDERCMGMSSGIVYFDNGQGSLSCPGVTTSSLVVATINESVTTFSSDIPYVVSAWGRSDGKVTMLLNKAVMATNYSASVIYSK